jgi:hypothetical protein
MTEPFEIIDPFEAIRDAFAHTETVERKQSIKPQQLVSLTAALAVVSIVTLTLVHTLSLGSGEHIASLNKPLASELTSSTTGSIPNADGADPRRLMLPDERTHAIDTTLVGGQTSGGELQKGQLAELNGEGSSPQTPDDTYEDAQWVQISGAAALHSGPSVDSPILSHYPAGIKLRTTQRQNGWVKIVDPATSQQGWIYDNYLSPSQGAERVPLPQQSFPPKVESPSTQAELDTPDESEFSIPDSSDPALKLKKKSSHRARGAFVIRFGFGNFRF